MLNQSLTWPDFELDDINLNEGIDSILGLQPEVSSQIYIDQSLNGVQDELLGSMDRVRDGQSVINSRSQQCGEKFSVDNITEDNPNQMKSLSNDTAHQSVSAQQCNALPEFDATYYSRNNWVDEDLSLKVGNAPPSGGQQNSRRATHPQMQQEPRRKVAQVTPWPSSLQSQPLKVPTDPSNRQHSRSDCNAQQMLNGTPQRSNNVLPVQISNLQPVQTRYSPNANGSNSYVSIQNVSNGGLSIQPNCMSNDTNTNILNKSQQPTQNIQSIIVNQTNDTLMKVDPPTTYVTHAAIPTNAGIGNTVNLVYKPAYLPANSAQGDYVCLYMKT